MRDGVVQWCDEVTGTAAIVRVSRTSPARSADLALPARRAGAPDFLVESEGPTS